MGLIDRDALDLDLVVAAEHQHLAHGPVVVADLEEQTLVHVAAHDLFGVIGFEQETEVRLAIAEDSDQRDRHGGGDSSSSSIPRCHCTVPSTWLNVNRWRASIRAAGSAIVAARDSNKASGPNRPFTT